MNEIKMAAIKVERRSIAVAIFIGRGLDYTQTRELASDFNKAQASAIGFINWVIATFRIQSAAIEIVPAGNAMRRSMLTDTIIEVFRDGGISLWDVRKHDLFQAFGVPALKSRRDLREVITSIWPILPTRNGKVPALDAVALGLYVQTERLFTN
jgi:hypothetical protein